MSSNTYIVDVDSNSSTSDISGPPSRQIRAQAPDAAEASTSDDSSEETDSSASSVSSEDSDSSSAGAPVLVSLESPLLAPIIIALNATDRCASAFANDGEDIVESIGYDPEWWRRATASLLPTVNREEAWTKGVAIELQRLNAFVDGKMDRKIAATSGLEELFRMKIPRLSERFLHINDIFACLGLLPALQKVLLNYAVVDGERIQLLPVGVSPELDSSTLQEALDDMFWAQVLEDADSDNPEDVPILEHLSDVVVVSCQSWNTRIDDKLWPERYTRKFLPEIQAKRKRRQALKRELKELQTELMDIVNINGANVPTSLEISCRAMRNAGHDTAAAELGSALEALNAKANARYSRCNELDKELSKESKSSLSIDHSSMTPYNLRSIVLFENEEDAATTITRTSASPAAWIWQSQNRCYAVHFDQVIAAAREADNYLAVYERESDPDAVARAAKAPSIERFCKADNAAFNFIAPLSVDEELDSPREATSPGSSMGDPEIVE